MDKLSKQDQFLQTLAAHERIVFKICHVYCKQEADREDLAQEIVLQLWKAFPRYDDRYKFSTWMYRIALNVAISFSRKSKRRREKMHALAGNLIEMGDPSFMENQHAERIGMLYHFIEQLDKMNKALMLLYLEEYSYEEIAEVLGISTSNVGTKLNRIRKKLTKKFEAIELI